jgi:hypothetical protein
MVHAAVRKGGPILGGVTVLVQSILDAVGNGGTLVAYVDWLSESRHSADLFPDDERLHVIGTLVREDGFHVGEMPGHVVVEQYPVTAEQIPRVGDHAACLLAIEHLRERRHSLRCLAFVEQTAEAKAKQLHADDLC